ncbi:hypothetical protein [Frigidibacter sp. SD6-1]|uniref:hypothetical protein n=1 Tax=Frigidibacter sp. SD6-1 TaxID=3032581 RepID=UPI0024DFFEC1|nr:hypothetical protein [Frigidibacter sp. SD6-1]
MPFVAQIDQIRWFAGRDVEAQKNKMKQVDESFAIRLLDRIMANGNPLNAAATQLQAICDQARLVVTNAPVQHPFQLGQQSLWDGYQPNDPDDKASNHIRALAQIHVISQNAVINPLALGDALFALADRFAESQVGGAIGDMRAFMATLQNAQAFSKTTNRIRIKRRDILSPIPPVGITQWYLPADDVLGTIDRMLGYYETGDISGSATNELTMLALAATVHGQNQIADLNAIKDEIVAMMQDGRALAVVAGMVAQLHHSMPEAMMALNLMPRQLRHAGPRITQIYSPFLTNIAFDSIANIYADWQQARWTVLGGQGQRPQNGGRALFILQDIFQMPNAPSDQNEVAMIVPFTYAIGQENPDSINPLIFGVGFYNGVVGQINTANPGPAITLEKLSREVFRMLFPGEFDPALPAQVLGGTIQARVQRGMQLAGHPFANADRYSQLIAPFLDRAEYGQVQAAQIAN